MIRRSTRKKAIEDYLNHYWIICRTRHGKTTYIRQRLIPEFKANYPNSSMVLFETKDEETIKDYLNSLDKSQLEKTLVYSPSDMKRYDLWIGLNLLQKYGDSISENTLLTNELIACFERAFGDSIKSNSKDIMRNGSLAVLEALPQASLLEVYKMFNDTLISKDKDKNRFRTNIVDSLTNPFLSNYFKTNFLFPSMATMDIYNPIYNKFRSITSDPIASNCLCQLDGIDLKSLINNGWNIVFFFPKGELGPELSRILSSIAFSKVQMAIQSRSSMSRESRLSRPVMIIADEFQDYAINNTSFHEFLNQAAGFGTSLVLSHQHIRQEGISESLIHSILGNIGNIVIGRIGDLDAGLLKEVIKISGKDRWEESVGSRIKIHPDKQPFNKEDLKSLKQFDFIERLTINGRLSDPRLISINRPKSSYTDQATKIRQESLFNFGIPGLMVKKDIQTRLESIDLESYKEVV